MQNNEYSCPDNINYSKLSRKFRVLSDILMEISEEMSNGVCSIPIFNLNVSALSIEGVPISSSTGHGGEASYNVENIIENTNINLSAPEMILSQNGHYSFSKWGKRKDNKDSIVIFSDEKDVSFSMQEDFQYVVAIYEWVQTSFDLEVRSKCFNTTENSSVIVSSSSGHGGRTFYQINKIDGHTSVNLIAPYRTIIGDNSYIFREWRLGESVEKLFSYSSQRNITFKMNEKIKICEALYVKENYIYPYYDYMMHSFCCDISEEEKKNILVKYESKIDGMTKSEIEEFIIKEVEKGDIGSEEAIFLASYHNIK